MGTLSVCESEVRSSEGEERASPIGGKEDMGLPAREWS